MSNYYKAFIRVVKSIAAKDEYFSGGFDTIEVIREPMIEATDKNEVKKIMLDKYPQFFQNGKVYEKETKNDKAQFFYVVIFPLYQHEIDLINEGQWCCDYCGQVYENKYLHKPLFSRKFEGKMFCNTDYKTGNDISYTPDCYDNWKKDYFKDVELPDDLNFVKADSPNYIYKCTEKSTGKCYIGKTRNAPFFRWWNHLTHSQSPFGLYLRTTNLSDWYFEVLDILPPGTKDEIVFKIESEYILKHDSIKNGFNSVISNKSAIMETGNLFTDAPL